MSAAPRFDLDLVPEKARYAAHRIAYLTPHHLIEEADRYLLDPSFEDVHPQWRQLRRAAVSLVQRCEAALRRLEGFDGPLPAQNDDLELFVGIRAPIVDAVRALIWMNEAWMRADREALNAYADVRGAHPLHAELQAEIQEFRKANERLNNALEAFLPAQSSS